MKKVAAGLRGGWTLAAILMLAAVLRVVGMNGGFPDINRYFWDSDEGGLAHIIMGFGTGDLNPHAFSQPTFFLYLVFALYALLYVGGATIGAFTNPNEFAYFYFVNPAPFYLIGRGVSVVAGVGTVWLLYRLGTKLFDRTTGLFAAFLLAVAGLHVEGSQIMKTDATSVLFVVAALICAAEIVETGSWRASWLAGSLAGLAAGTRYPSGSVFLCVIASHFMLTLRTGRPWWTAIGSPRLWTSGVSAILTFLVVAPFTVLDWNTFSAQVRFLSRLVGGAGDPYQLGYRPNFWTLHWIQLAEPNVLGLALVVLVLLGCAVSLSRHRWQDMLLWPVPLFLYWFYSDNFTFTRTIVPPLYLLPAVPTLLLLAARSVTDLARTGPRRAIAITAVVVAVLPHLFATTSRSVQFTHASTKVVAKRWIEDNVPRGSRILVERAQIPQLSFTPASLVRRRSTQAGGYGAELGESRRTALNADVSAANLLRTKSLTEVGVPYDLFVLQDTTEEPQPEALDFYQRGFTWTVSTYGMEYVVVSSFIYGIFFDDPYDDLRLYHSGYRNFVEALNPQPAAWASRRRFYEDIESHGQLIMDVRPESGRTAGPRIKIYKVL